MVTRYDRFPKTLINKKVFIMEVEIVKSMSTLQIKSEGCASVKFYKIRLIIPDHTNTMSE